MATTRILCPWCQIAFPIAGRRYGYLMDEPEPYHGVTTPLPYRVCSPACPERPDGVVVVDIAAIGLPLAAIAT